jgi:hypothetical protein
LLSGKSALPPITSCLAEGVCGRLGNEEVYGRLGNEEVYGRLGNGGLVLGNRGGFLLIRRLLGFGVGFCFGIFASSFAFRRFLFSSRGSDGSPLNEGVDVCVIAGMDACVIAGVDACVTAGVDACVTAGVDACVIAGVDVCVIAGADVCVTAGCDGVNLIEGGGGGGIR